MDYHILSNTGKIVASNLSLEKIEKNFQKCKKDSIRAKCPVKNKMFRQGKVTTQFGTVYLATYDEEMTERSFNRYMEIYSSFINDLEDIQVHVCEQELVRFRRLKHNLVNYNTHTLQGIYKFISQDTLAKGGKNQISIIESAIKADTRATAELLLKILKNANLEKAEYDVYDMLYKTSPILDFQHHSIHKVIYLTLTTYWLDFLEKNIDVFIDDSNIELCFDYKSMSVVLGHIFDNALKYAAPNSNIEIKFKGDQKKFNVIFDMVSLKIEDDEIEDIFNEGVSGAWSKKSNTNGGGYGLYAIKSLSELNNVHVSMKTNLNKLRVLRSSENIHYENNQMILEFNYPGDC